MNRLVQLVFSSSIGLQLEESAFYLLKMGEMVPLDVLLQCIEEEKLKLGGLEILIEI